MVTQYYFYKTINLINKKYYYGSGSSSKPYHGSGKNILCALKKYGINNFFTEKLRFFNTREDAYLFEERFLKLYKISSDRNSYNIKDAALGGDPFTNNPNKERIRENYRKSMKKQLLDPKRRKLCNSFRNLTPEMLTERKKIWSAAQKGSKNGRFKYSKKVAQLDIETNSILHIYDYVRDLDKLNFNSKYVINCCNGISKTHKKYKWQWLD